MNIREDIKQLKTSDRDLRKFGIIVGAVFLSFALDLFKLHKPIFSYLLWPGAVLVLFGAILPRALKWVYIAWMSVAFVLGFIMSHVILALLFFLVITPIGLVARLVGKDFLSLKLDRAAKSYWIPREKKPKSAADYERQF